MPVTKRYRLKFILPVISGGIALLLLIVWILRDGTPEASDVPQVLGHREGCLNCHQAMSGFSPAHDPTAIGCTACHLGDPFSLEKKQAHRDMVLIPGNLNNAGRTCGAAGCHPLLNANLHLSLMATGRGIVAVNRYVFGESNSPNGEGSLSELGDSPAESHLRKLCASCHLGKSKTIPEPIDELSRGGGCTACHLQYSDSARQALQIYQQSQQLPTVHPALTIQVSDAHCFGCHSRSGRISTNYQGWHETQLSSDQAHDSARFRVLQDGRVFVHQTADVHFQRGMACIDCHTWRETMGDGRKHLHQEDQVEISCQDCHRNAPPKTAPDETLGEIELKILKLRNIKRSQHRFILTSKSGNPLLNVLLENGHVVVQGKNSGKEYHPKAPQPVCTSAISGHERLTCQGCHTAWAPQCISCHTEFEPGQMGVDHLSGKRTPGRWVEYSGEFLAEPPALGIRRENGREVVDTFIPGMILTINPERQPGQVAGKEYRIFRRLYAPTAAHTTVSKGRDCNSCHANPVALGYGRGKLTFRKINKRQGRWEFEPLYAPHPADGLPDDAWISFLQTRSDMVSTRSGARPFNRSEQEEILQVGACLTCHSPTPQNISRIYSHFAAALRNLSPQCLRVEWQ